jgi:D-alanyl-D-alanine carboxypeptidase
MLFSRLVLFFVLAFATVAPVAAKTPAFIVIDQASGGVLAEKDAGKPWYPASITKLMTAYVTFKALRSGTMKPSTPVTVSANALKEPPSKMGFPVGTTMTLDNALKMMLVKSANDIAVAVAETVGGSEAGFVQRMNAEAKRLGMNSTHFANPNGLPDSGHVTTARDMALLARTIWSEFPEQRELFRISAIRSGGRVLRTHNSLIERYRGASGMKTGFICASGFNVVATATRNGKSLIAVVLGSETARERTELAAKLLDAGFAGATPGPKRDILTFDAVASTGVPVDMRDQVCRKRNKNEGEEEDDPILAGMSGVPSALEPKRFYVMDPVEVTTLYVPPQPDPPKKASKKSASKKGTKKVAQPAGKSPAKTADVKAADDKPAAKKVTAAAGDSKDKGR